MQIVMSDHDGCIMFQAFCIKLRVHVCTRAAMTGSALAADASFQHPRIVLGLCCNPLLKADEQCYTLF